MGDVPECSTCGRQRTPDISFVTFPCPGCTEEEIARCEQCRKRSNVYACEACGFEGP